MQTARADGARPHAAPRTSQELSVIAPAPPGVRAQQLFDEARRAAGEHLATLAAAIDETRALAEIVAEAGSLYGPGISDLAHHLAEDLGWRAKSLAALQARQADLRPTRHA